MSDQSAPPPAPRGGVPKPSGVYVVAVVLAVGVCTALNLVVVGSLLEALFLIDRQQGSGISENATQILTGAFGGIISIIGAVVGYNAGAAATRAAPAARAAPDPVAPGSPPDPKGLS